MKFVFFGSPEFAAIVLEKLIKAGFIPAAVVCAPDAPAGRKKILTSPPTKVLAEKYNIEVWQPEKLEIKNWKLKITNPDLAIVAAYGKIIPKNIIKTAKYGFVGVHPSLLPKYRGASPIQSAILNDEAETGTTLYLMDEKVDHGPILMKSEFRISKSETYLSLHNKLAELSGDLFIKILPDFIAEKIKPRPQDESQATFTQKFSLKDGMVDFKKDDPRKVWLKIRALNPEPGVTARLKLKDGQELKLKLLEADYNPSAGSASSLQASSGQALELKLVQPEGKKPMLWKDFLNGYQDKFLIPNS